MIFWNSYYLEKNSIQYHIDALRLTFLLKVLSFRKNILFNTILIYCVLLSLKLSIYHNIVDRNSCKTPKLRGKTTETPLLTRFLKQRKISAFGKYINPITWTQRMFWALETRGGGVPEHNWLDWWKWWREKLLALDLRSYLS